ncbi:LysE family translocator [Marinobacter fonticola]|uniref:LysE family translocator n=1 Tax=Marinobacter fonticola TaxID=2603215 RepID=UPI0011E7069C|nr:LysE family transporter [Marinobacter fonticola]
MDSYTALFSVATIWLVAALTPGPNFLVTVRMAITGSRSSSLQTVAGIVVATLIWATAGFLGIHSLFKASPWMYVLLKALGGAYLIWLGLKLFWTSTDSTEELVTSTSSPARGWRAFRLGFVTNMANPKTALFVSGLFAVAMPVGAPIGLGLSAIAIMVAISLAWYSTVAWLFASKRVAACYVLLRKWIDRLAGTCFVVFGIGLVRE